MRRLQLDFLRTRPVVPWVAWLLLASGLLVLALVATRYADLEQALGRERDQASRLERENRIKPARAGAGLSRAQALPEEQGLLSLAWGPLFEGLEQTRTAKIALLSLEADAGKSAVEISAEAKTPGQMLDYLNALRSQPGFSAVTLSSHIIDDENPQRPVLFVVRLKWSDHAPRP